MFKSTPAILIIGITIFIVSITSIINKKVCFKLLLHPFSIVREKQYYRLITSDFVHHDYFHLIINEVLLFTYGGNLEKFLNERLPHGSLIFIAIYWMSCLSGSVFTTIRNRTNFGYSSAGASGSVMGCLFSFTILQPNLVAFVLPVFGNVTNIYFGLICIVGIAIYRGNAKDGLMNHDLHFFGGLGGFIGTLIFCPGVLNWPG